VRVWIQIHVGVSLTDVTLTWYRRWKFYKILVLAGF